MDQKKHLVEFLKKELGSVEAVKDFSECLRQFNIADLRQDEDIVAVTANEGAYLYSLVTYYQFGLFSKLKDIQNKIKNKGD